jgi:transcriptional regulator with XRE-family HTH domain
MTEPKFFRSVVGTRIRYLRTLRRMDQSVLADAIGIYPSTLNKIENGSYGLDTVDAVKISEALKVSLDELLAVPSEEPEHAAK